MSLPERLHLLGQVEAILVSLGARLMTLRRSGLKASTRHRDQVKSEADIIAHEFLVHEFSHCWGGVPIVSEEDESGHVARSADRYWLIDPIDGTASYCDGFDGFVTQAALMEAGRPVLGVVHGPALHLTYKAAIGTEPTCNNAPIRVSSRHTALVLIDNYPEPRGIARRVYDALGFRRYIESGSIALKICRVADGTADLFVKDVPVRDWDLAPAHLLLESAGGALASYDGSPVTYSGPVEKHGLLAASSQRMIDAVTTWQREAAN